MFTVSTRGQQKKRGRSAAFSEKKISDLIFRILEFTFFSPKKTSILAVGPTHTLIQYIMRVLRPGPEVNDSFPPNVEIKNEWIYNSTPPYAFMAWTGTIFFSPFTCFWDFYTASTGK
jgi:hypothetical protein